MPNVVVRATRDTILVLAVVLGTLLASGGSDAEERRLIITPDADYTGFDASTVKDVDLEACKAACLADNTCRAFTYNNAAKWCFLKSDFGVLESTPGATAGRVVVAQELTPSLERQRLGELNFLSTYLVDEARAQLNDLKNRFSSDGLSFGTLRDAGGASYRAGNYQDAAQSFGRALTIANEDVGAWLDFAVASIGRNPENWSDRQQAATDASAAAINAYLRAETPADRAEALALLGDGLAKREYWKDAIRAYRASLAIVDNATVRVTYDKAVAEHGFRVVSHEVDADVATPRICVVFSDSLPVSRPDLTDYVTVTGGEGLAIEPQDRQICIDGVKHGGRYDIRVRGGLPAADGEVLAHPVELDVYIRDRAPWIGFTGNAYVLPAGENASIPMVSVNTGKAKATIYRIGDRSIASAIRNNEFLRQLDRYSATNIGDQSGEKVWEGTIGINSTLNEMVTTAIPIADAVTTLKPGAYVITAAPETDTQEWGSIATQWFIVSDLGLTTLSGNDGIHAIVRSLSSAEPVSGVKLRLVAVNDEVLGEATTDANGIGLFEPGLARGTGGMAPQLVTAEIGGDYAFIDLSRSAFDLTDRGVDGRPAPGALDVFLTPERGIYRPGETIHLTALVRDAKANAVNDLPLTLIVERPDGVEFLRTTLSDGGLGGYTSDVVLQAGAMRGSWRIKLYADVKGNALTETSVLVEDFEPERLAFEITTEAKVLEVGDTAKIDLAARYLYGAPAPDLGIEGEVEVKAIDTMAAFPGYKFGLVDDKPETLREPISVDDNTDADGKAGFNVSLPQLPTSTKQFEATFLIRLADTNGRAVERTLSLPVQKQGPSIGIKPLFEADVEEGGNARFDIILVDADGQRIAKPSVPWKLEKVESDYQWYRTNGNWNYEVVTKTQRVGSGTLDTKADGATTISVPVDWGSYRFTVEDDSEQPSATSFDFYAGWYASVATSDTPDTLQVGLDKPAYRIGETAKLRLDPRFAGIALVTVIDDRLIAMKAVEVPEGGTTVDLEVTSDWGPGAYVTAALYRPMDIAAKRMPSRALGLAWAKVAPGDRLLNVTLGVAPEMRPRGPMTIPVAIGNLKDGEEAFVTVAAVDVGILNLTNFKTPAPDEWYFGQRKLGIDIRDVYGLLIDRMQGVPGTVRSGGDGGPTRLSAPPPTQKLLAFYSGIVAVADGKATVTFDIPDFNGSVRVMAMAWSKEGVGHAATDVIVRDPVVVTASIPRFLAAGDSSRLLVEINNVAGAAGDYRLNIDAADGLEMAENDLERTVTLAEKQRLAFNIPITGKVVGDYEVTVSLATPSGENWPLQLALGVRPAGEPVTRRNIVAVNAGGKLTVSDETLAEFVPGTGSIAVSLGGAGPLDVAGILAALDRYPYGCSEQLTSRALPLVYLDEVATSVGIGADADVKKRVQKAIDGVLANQAANGSFGLWGPENTGDLWLDAYVTDFLTRAAEKGYDVPDLARTLSLDNLSNRISYADDFDKGGEDIAYALYVLARTGRAAIGDLRYYAETKLQNFRTPLAKAQIGAALSLYGDRQRANRVFAAAMADLGVDEDRAIWRSDYGTKLRDEAAVLTLAAESEGNDVDVRSLATRIAATEANRRYTSTQENAWMLMAAAALIKDASRSSFAIDGASVAGPLFKRFSGTTLASAPVVIENLGSETLDAVVAATGIPTVPEPEGGEGFKIIRDYYTPEGELADVATVAQNDRFVVALTVTADAAREGKILIVDPIPAGFEIENPNISASGDTGAYSWLGTDTATHTEARTDRFVAALDREEGDSLEFSVAYTMRAVSPGKFAAPAATVEDMYRPELQARTATGTVEVVGPTR